MIALITNKAQEVSPYLGMFLHMLKRGPDHFWELVQKQANGQNEFPRNKKQITEK